jgi:hypothetical protein
MREKRENNPKQNKYRTRVVLEKKQKRRRQKELFLGRVLFSTEQKKEHLTYYVFILPDDEALGDVRGKG